MSTTAKPADARLLDLSNLSGAGGDGVPLVGDGAGGLKHGSSSAGSRYSHVAPSGADYASVDAAVAAGKSLIRVIQDTTEPGQINSFTNKTPIRYLIVVDPDVTLTLPSICNWDADANQTVHVSGHGTLAKVGSDTFFHNIGADAGQTAYVLTDLHMDWSSYTGNGSLNDAQADIHYVRCTCTSRNGQNIWINAADNDGKYSMRDSTIIGGGVSCNQIIFAVYNGSTNPQVNLDNVTVTGTFSTSSNFMIDFGTFTDVKQRVSINGLHFRGGSSGFGITIGGTVRNITTTSGQLNRVDIEGGDCNFSESNIPGCTLRLSSAQTWRPTFNMVTSINTILFASDPNGGAEFTNCSIKNAGSTEAYGSSINDISFTNCKWQDRVEITGDRFRFINCRCAPDGAGDANATFVTIAGSDFCVFLGCVTDVAISTAGGANHYAPAGANKVI